MFCVRDRFFSFTNIQKIWGQERGHLANAGGKKTEKVGAR